MTVDILTPGKNAAVSVAQSIPDSTQEALQLDLIALREAEPQMRLAHQVWE